MQDMKLSDLQKLLQIFNCVNENESYWQIGKAYFIRTVTMHLIGKIKSYTDKELLLEHAVWVADSGRFHDALKTGSLNEVEPFINDVILNRDCIVDASEWTHKIPSEQKGISQ